MSFEISNQLNGLLSLFFTRRHRRRCFFSAMLFTGHLQPQPFPPTAHFRHLPLTEIDLPPPPSGKKGKMRLPELCVTSGKHTFEGWNDYSSEKTVFWTLLNSIGSQVYPLGPFDLRHAINGKIHRIPSTRSTIRARGGKIGKCCLWCYSNFDSFSCHCVPQLCAERGGMEWE